MGYLQDINIEDYIPRPGTEELSIVDINTDSDKSLVPRTLGSRRKTSDEVTAFLLHEKCMMLYYMN